ncbi:aldo/keto reductase [Breznakiella homolactica]|uniref:Aldo/keto reductase n=1 Tax=Breznakiella homolactica TaxID=2798577 RepID=A0A7T8BDN9_9SPIR|nr:aldo/keto reductase [Breznakiella homolactica]QQO11433.1 aldo/keto reductase [Breznakiella homolactica]
METKIDRRTFIKGFAAAAAGVGLAVSGAGKVFAEPRSGTAGTGTLPTRILGKTGAPVTILGLGGLFTTSMASRRDEAVQIVNRAIDLGVNYIDTSAMYGGGGSETNIGYVMKDRRDEVFLATKSHDYTYDGAMRLFEQSLRRLQTDRIDLYQHHYLNSQTLGQLRGRNSARQAFEKLRDDGTVRFLGVTGHSSRVLADALEDYPYDCALITLNAAGEVMDDPGHLDRFFRIAREKNVGVIAMKVVARGDLITRGLTIRQLLPYVLSYPVSTAVIGISDIQVLEEDVRVAKEFRPMAEPDMRDLEARARR